MKSCPRCGLERLDIGPEGLCPVCLMARALATETVESACGLDISGTDSFIEQEDFGRYRILRRLGQGGMGAVYLAEQQEPVRRHVAVKVVKPGMDSKEVLSRFRKESQAVAMVDHPNVAGIFDAGVNSGGRPYFVMEYVDGLPITEYCDRRRLTVMQRLEIFLPVCRAIHYGHQKGIIHRDIKPSNILVTENDGRPSPKVIDFGIAKLVDGTGLHTTISTRSGEIVGTPEYMSPEQANAVPGELDASSDVYSLGVLLYELLVGALPFDREALFSAGLAEELSRIREAEIPSLPDRLTSRGEAGAATAALRGTDPAGLRKLLDADLNWIVMKALEKSPERRYRSASDLAADIERHMADLPVLAGPPSRLYRAQKYLRRHKLAVTAAVAVIFLPALGGGAVWTLSRYRESLRKFALTDKDTVVVSEFRNTTGDPVFDGALRQGLEIQLSQSPFLSVITAERVERVLRQMGQSAGTLLTPRLAREICQRTGSAAVLEGSIAPVGNQYVIGLSAENCSTGSVLAQEQAQAPGKEEVLRTLSSIAGKFRTRLGESLVSVEKYSKPLPEATTSSLEALKAYSEASNVAFSKGFAASLPFFRRAVEIDPEFALAHANLGLKYSTIGESVRAAESTKRAYDSKDRVTDKERFFITFTYHRQVTGNLEKALEILDMWAQAYPRDPTAHGLLSGFSTIGTGRFEKSVEEAANTLQLDPDHTPEYETFAISSLALNRVAKAQETLQRAAGRKLDAAFFYALRFYIAFLKGDAAEMDRESALAAGKTEAADLVLHCRALALARSGRLRLAREASRDAVNLAVQAGKRERAAHFQTGAAVWEAFYGNSAAARQTALDALALSRGRDVDYGAAFALALAGEPARAKRIGDDLDRRFPEDTSVRFNYLPALQALSSLAALRPKEAIVRLEGVGPYELAIPGLAFNGFFGALYPAYVRGMAYLAERRGGDAAAEFRKIIDQPGIVLADPVGAMARLQLARALALSADYSGAKSAYEEVLNLWKAADPDVPVVQQARSEFAALKQKRL